MTTIVLLAVLAIPAFGQSSHGYLGAKGQFAYRMSHPGFNNDAWHLVHRMGLAGGSYRLLGKKNMAGIGVEGRIHSNPRWYYFDPESDNWYRNHGDEDDYGRESRTFQDWDVPIDVELQYVRLPSGQPREGRYYRAGIRTTRYLLRRKGDWHWDIVDGGNLSFYLGAGHSWKVGAANSVRLEGNLVLEGEWYIFELAMNFGRWWN